METVIRGQLLRRIIKVSFSSLTSTCKVVGNGVHRSISDQLFQPAVGCNKDGSRVENT